MRADPAQRLFPRLGRLRIEEVEADVFLPRILHLRATSLSRRISLAPDVHAWADPIDRVSSHWGVFNDNELVASARLSICSGSQLEALHPVAMMSHCVVDPRFRDCRLDAMLDVARIERARQLGCARLCARPESPRRVRKLAALGFTRLARAGFPSGSADAAYVLDLSREAQCAAVNALHPPSG